jgi:hypothetical protein
MVRERQSSQRLVNGPPNGHVNEHVKKQPNGHANGNISKHGADDVDHSRWRLSVGESGRHTWHYMKTDEDVEKWPLSIADKWHLGLPTVCTGRWVTLGRQLMAAGSTRSPSSHKTLGSHRKLPDVLFKTSASHRKLGMRIWGTSVPSPWHSDMLVCHKYADTEGVSG